MSITALFSWTFVRNKQKNKYANITYSKLYHQQRQNQLRFETNELAFLVSVRKNNSRDMKQIIPDGKSISPRSRQHKFKS